MKKVRKNIMRVACVLCILLALLAVYAVFSVKREGNRWFSSQMNAGLVREQQKNVLPGDILDRNGTVLATVDSEGRRVYRQDNLERCSVAHVLGDTRGGVTNGVESFMARSLYGFDRSFLEQCAPLLKGEKPKGDSIRLTLDSALSGYIASVFPAGRSGAAVVMNWKTGEVLAELSFPLIDPETADYSSADRSAFINKAVQLLKAPGSTFKTVTAACALRNRAAIELWSFECGGYLEVGERKVTCAGTDLNRGLLDRHGSLTLKQAYAKSCNSAFADLALDLGDGVLRKTAEEFGFNDNFLFEDIVVENSVYPAENRTELEIAWTGAGQSALLATPMHMCMIASSVANGGVMAEPKLVLSVMSETGKTRKSFSPSVYRTPLTKNEAETLKEFMRETVVSGTGKSASISGYTVCGKTGSAEMDDQANTDAWFTGFIAEESAPYAVTVTVLDAGGGGSVAAPVAGKIFEYLTENMK